MPPGEMLPPETPITMPEQAFGGPAPEPTITLATPGAVQLDDDMLARRVLLVLLTALFATGASVIVKESLFSDGFSLWDILLLLLFFPLFGWIAFGFVTAAIGFTLLITGIHPGFVPIPRRAMALKGRTAVLMPIHNEEVDEVFGRLGRMAAMLHDTGQAGHFDLFILSDSAPAAEAAETAAWARLAACPGPQIYYRRRTENTGRKPGNVADWIRRFGGGYDYMLMLDADSLMGGDAILGMTQIMEQRPAIALLQTVPTVIGATTLFQRWMQFASRLYGPISTAGLVWWSGSESTFWGHNALIRVAAFAESCGLPELPGRPPFGGTIMSHDMVEAALLRRRGWRVHMIMIDETYEEYPPTLIDQAVRDRRWAQGNIQHLRLIGSSGFHWINRLQLFIGASAYLTSPAWLLLIAATIAQEFLDSVSVVRTTTSIAVLIVTLLLLFGPKVMSIIWAVSDPDRRAGFGGTGGILRSVMLDIPLAILTAPAIALTQTIDLINILRGRKSGWDAQNRASDGLTVSETLPRYLWHVGVGIILLMISLHAPRLGWWLSPVTLGMLASPALASWTASARTGARYARDGYFHVPDTIADRP